MVREVLTISVGQAGVQLGNAIWEQYCVEHGIGKRGTFEAATGLENVALEKFLAQKEEGKFKTFFNELSSGVNVPRCVAVDLEPNVIDERKRGAWQGIFNVEDQLSGQEDAANNFARGHYTVGKEMMDFVNERLRQLVDNSENVQGFMMNHSVGGGTGSGLGMLILERIAVDYRKKSKLGFEIYPSPNQSTCIVEPYNALLSTHWLLDHTDVSIVLDNEALYEMCKKKLDVKNPSYGALNKIISKVASSMTAALRFTGELNVDLNEFQTNLVPFPRIHFMTTSLAPVISKAKEAKDDKSIRAITSNSCNSENFLVKCPDFDVVEDKYMAISLNYRGDVKSKHVNDTVKWLKEQNKVSFVNWCPTGFKIGLNNQPAKATENEAMAPSSVNCVMIGNNVCISRVFQTRLSAKYDKMYGQRAYVHWFVGEGMEEGEFSEAREDLGFLEKDFLDVTAEKASDDVNDEEEETGEF